MFKLIVLSIALNILSACEMKVKSDPIKTETAQIVQSGESYTYIVIKLDFIEQIKQLCLDSNPQTDSTVETEYKKLIADCTLQHMNIFNISPVQTMDFIGKYCSPTSDLSGLTPDQLKNITAACIALTPN
jgi:hypothetical protein